MTYEEKIKRVQQHLKEQRIDGWLLYSFQKSNDLAYNFLELGNIHATRRFFYWIPQTGTPVKLVHTIENSLLDHVPGEKKMYSSWQSLYKELFSFIKNKKKIAMEFSSQCNNPYVSKVDGGTIDLIRQKGVEIVSSSSFLPYFTAVLSDKEIALHCEAAEFLDKLMGNTWQWISEQLNNNKTITEYDVQQRILEHFDRNHFITDAAPICAINEHGADPHYEPMKEKSSIIKKGDFILIDQWCKKDLSKSIYGDITNVAIADKKPSNKQKEIFSIVRQAQQATVDLISQRLEKNESIQGWEADQVCRDVIKQAGYEKYFTHRTGHNIEKQLHGSGAHLDNLEMHDTRLLLVKTCFSIEPGIYLPKQFGVRLELDAYISVDKKLVLTGGVQDEIKCLF